MAILPKDKIQATLTESAQRLQQVRKRNEAARVAELANEPQSARTTPIEVTKR